MRCTMPCAQQASGDASSRCTISCAACQSPASRCLSALERSAPLSCMNSGSVPELVAGAGFPAWAADAARASARGTDVHSDEIAEFLGGHWSCEEEALRLLAAERAQERGLRVELDAFGDDGEAEGVRHVDDRAHDRRVGLVLQDIGDEGTVDLERSKREAREVRQARVAGAE